MSKERGMFGSLLRGLQRLGAAFREKPQVSLEDYELEHFMLYHGLVGTSPEDQPKFKDVRADIFDAILKKSSVEMAIALKLPPLWWEDKLAAIFAEAHEYRDEVVACLMPPIDPFTTAPEADPVHHPDWRVRANSAKILANMEVHEAIPALVTALEDEDETQKAGFCHIAYALSKMHTPQTRMALTKQLDNTDPWLRVDAFAALSKWPLKEVSADLMEGLLKPNSMSDYAAVAVAREHKLSELLQLPGHQAEGALEVVVGVLQALQSTYANDTTLGAELESSFGKVEELTLSNPNPRRVRALLDLCDYIIENGESSAVQLKAQSAKSRFAEKKFSQDLLGWFEKPQAERNGEFRHAVKLAAHYKMAEVAPHVIEELKPDSSYVNESVEAMARIGGTEAAPHLVRLIDQLVDLDDRTSKTLSKAPVFEENPASAKTYWMALRAMGSLPQTESLDCLLRASKDFASDKRQQAIESLIEIGRDHSIRTKYGDKITETVRSAFADPAAGVRVAAIAGIAKLGLIDMISDVVKLTWSRETAVARQAKATLLQLAAEGHGAEVSAALKAGLASEKDVYRRQRLTALLADVS